MALHYAPRINGSSTWQLYPEFNVEATWPRNQWTHVRLEIRGSRLEVFVGDSAAPLLTVPRLRHGFTDGAVAAGRSTRASSMRATSRSGFRWNPAPTSSCWP